MRCTIAGGQRCAAPCHRTAGAGALVLLRHKCRPHPEERAEGPRLEGWRQLQSVRPSFETARFAGLLRMRLEQVSDAVRFAHPANYYKLRSDDQRRLAL